MLVWITQQGFKGSLGGPALWCTLKPLEGLQVSKHPFTQKRMFTLCYPPNLNTHVLLTYLKKICPRPSPLKAFFYRPPNVNVGHIVRDMLACILESWQKGQEEFLSCSQRTRVFIDKVDGPLDGDDMWTRNIYTSIYYLIQHVFTSFQRPHNLWHTRESMLASHPSRHIGYAV